MAAGPRGRSPATATGPYGAAITAALVIDPRRRWSRRDHAPDPPPPATQYGAATSVPHSNRPPGTNWSAIALIFGVLGGVLISVICGIVGLQPPK